MIARQAYNPLDKKNLARSLEGEILAQPMRALSDTTDIVGCGVYAIYYSGDFPLYERIRTSERGVDAKPIYVGKAIPKGGRKGVLAFDQEMVGREMAERLRTHAGSIDDCSNLRVEDFSYRCLVIDEIWIPLGENILIQRFRPVWNGALDGFGNKTPGAGRHNQIRPIWDVVHPGRPRFAVLRENPASVSDLEQRVRDYLDGKPLKPLPKASRGGGDVSEDEE